MSDHTRPDFVFIFIFIYTLYYLMPSNVETFFTGVRARLTRRSVLNYSAVFLVIPAMILVYFGLPCVFYNTNFSLDIGFSSSPHSDLHRVKNPHIFKSRLLKILPGLIPLIFGRELNLYHYINAGSVFKSVMGVLSSLVTLAREFVLLRIFFLIMLIIFLVASLLYCLIMFIVAFYRLRGGNKLYI